MEIMKIKISCMGSGSVQLANPPPIVWHPVWVAVHILIALLPIQVLLVTRESSGE